MPTNNSTSNNKTLEQLKQEEKELINIINTKGFNKENYNKLKELYLNNPVLFGTLEIYKDKYINTAFLILDF